MGDGMLRLSASIPALKRSLEAGGDSSSSEGNSCKRTKTAQQGQAASGEQPIEIVYYDFETSGLEEDDEILQIGAKVGASGAEFSAYCTPTWPICEDATRINGLSYHRGQLYLEDEPVDSVSLREGLSAFLRFLAGLKARVVLVAHNGNRFDHWFLLRDVDEERLRPWFDQVVWRFADSLPLFRRVLDQTWGLRLSDLTRRYLGRAQQHDALSDARQLKQLMDYFNVSKQKVLGYAYPPSELDDKY